ncbi:hypothetical protein N7447_008475 [Penicillium robsamsonii]|uniref:uncharacterized protein n=1 Tax=Penicillium robsamsonii TaxID=1792511 RepID=UPI0025492C97|nr:uncharacterized protein N7447_008475 [Penicillium robsamsonii]KAJ5816242.1 hypothetical protein N7447_008475 [Penicillium robsamsonii]
MPSSLPCASSFQALSLHMMLSDTASMPSSNNSRTYGFSFVVTSPDQPLDFTQSFQELTYVS